MRLWTIHPKYLDQKGLVALWRESLLAKSVLEGNTTGYVNHPQLTRFRKFSDPVMAINKYLSEVCEEAGKRGYSFNKNKCEIVDFFEKVDVTNGQVEYEVNHLKKKLTTRDPDLRSKLSGDTDVFSIFNIVPGEVEDWEKVTDLD
jgi:hypothetical protein